VFAHVRLRACYGRRRPQWKRYFILASRTYVFLLERMTSLLVSVLGIGCWAWYRSNPNNDRTRRRIVLYVLCSLCMHPPVHTVASCRGRPRRTWSFGWRRWRNDHLRLPSGIMNFKGHRERQLSHEIEAVAAVYSGHFRRKMTVVEIIIAELHCCARR